MTTPSRQVPANNGRAAFGSGPACLVMIAGPQIGQIVKVLGEVVIGRSTSVEFSIKHSTISRRHARIIPTLDGHYVFDDLDSKNGSQINGIPTKSARLEFGDELQLGSCILLKFTPSELSENHAANRRRLEAVGRVGAGVAHDLNNMLGAISASVDFLAQIPCSNSDHTPEVADCLSDIRTALAHAGELTQGIMLFVRGESRPHEAVDISSLCTDVLRLLKHTFDSSIHIEREIAPDQVVFGDQAELHLVLMNLCLNARDAMPHGGTLRLTVTGTTSKAMPGREHRDVPCVQVEIEDTGIGMDEATRARIFEPFFTTKPQGVGFGIGLTTTLQVLEAHGSHADVRSAPNAGTTFRLFFPLMDEARRKVVEVSKDGDVGPKSRRGSGANILLADDEDVVRRSLSRLLRHAGYHVQEVKNGVEAVDAFNASHPRPDLTILDLDMPRLNGVQTRRMIHSIDPGARLLFLSGNDYGGHPEYDMSPDHIGYLRKPCDGKLLLATIEQLLGTTPLFPDVEEHTSTE